MVVMLRVVLRLCELKELVHINAVLMLEQVTDFLKLLKRLVRVVDDQPVDNFHNVLVKVSHVVRRLGVAKQFLKLLVLLDCLAGQGVEGSLLSNCRFHF